MFNSSKRVSIVCRGWNCSHAPACILSLSRMPHIVTVIFPIIVSPLRWFVLSCISADDDQTIQTYGIAHLKLRECQGTSVFTSLTVRQKFDCATCMTMYLHDRYVMIHSTMNYNDLYKCMSKFARTNSGKIFVHAHGRNFSFLPRCEQCSRLDALHPCVSHRHDSNHFARTANPTVIESRNCSCTFLQSTLFD